MNLHIYFHFCFFMHRIMYISICASLYTCIFLIFLWLFSFVDLIIFSFLFLFYLLNSLDSCLFLSWVRKTVGLRGREVGREWEELVEGNIKIFYFKKSDLNKRKNWQTIFPENLGDMERENTTGNHSMSMFIHCISNFVKPWGLDITSPQRHITVFSEMLAYL